MADLSRSGGPLSDIVLGGNQGASFISDSVERALVGKRYMGETDTVTKDSKPWPAQDDCAAWEAYYGQIP
jgi:hypothetical protein